MLDSIDNTPRLQSLRSGHSSTNFGNMISPDKLTGGVGSVLEEIKENADSPTEKVSRDDIVVGGQSIS